MYPILAGNPAKSTRKMCEICPKLTINTSERQQWRCWGTFIVDLEEVRVSWENCCYHVTYAFSEWIYTLKLPECQGIPCSKQARLWKRVHDMIITYSQMDCTGKNSQHSLIIWSVWLNSWVFVFKQSGLWVRISLLSLKPQISRLKERVPWRSGNYRE